MCTCSDQCQTIERARPIQYLNSVIYFLTHIFSVVLCSMENEQSVCRSFSLWTMKTRVLKTETTQVAIHSSSSSSSRPHVRCAFKFKIAFTTHVCKKFYGFSNTIILTNKMEKNTMQTSTRAEHRWCSTSKKTSIRNERENNWTGRTHSFALDFLSS